MSMFIHVYYKHMFLNTITKKKKPFWGGIQASQSVGLICFELTI